MEDLKENIAKLAPPRSTASIEKWSKTGIIVSTFILLITAIAGSVSVFVDGPDKPSELRDLTVTVLATALFGLLYFLSQWIRDVVKPVPLHGAVLNCWLAMVCSTIVCLTGVLAFGVTSCASAKLTLGNSMYGMVAWLVPLGYVVVLASCYVCMLVGLLRWYVKFLRSEDVPVSVALHDDAIKQSGLFSWQHYCDLAIVIFTGMGITSVCWLVSGNSVRVAAALGHVFSLLFGLFGVGLYATSVNTYIKLLRNSES